MTPEVAKHFDDYTAETTSNQKYILYVLEREGPLTRDGLQAETALPMSSVDNALSQLDSKGAIQRNRMPNNPRQVIISFAESEEDDEQDVSNPLASS